MKRVILKFSAFILLVLVIFSAFPADSFAYVSVRGYTRSNGTYVAPHVRSSPNAFKFDNYSWTPSQGLYNKSYYAPTKNYSSDWYTPSYITDPNYYVGKSLYESGQSGISSYTAPKPVAPTYVPSYVPSYGGTVSSGISGGSVPPPKTSNVVVPSNAHLNYSGDGWLCDKGYKENYTTQQCDYVAVPANAHLNYYGDGWYCDTGYKQVGSYCEQVIVPANASLSSYGSDWYCNSGYKTKFDSSYNKVGCEQIIVPPNASLSSYGSDWYCNAGYKTRFDNSFNKIGCEQIIVPANASLSSYGSDWYCNSGYKTTYDNYFNKIGCTPQ